MLYLRKFQYWPNYSGGKRLELEGLAISSFFLMSVLAIICLAAWIYLIAARGWFWLCSVRDTEPVAVAEHWPSVVAVIPARNETACIAESVRSLLRQHYPGPLSVIVVDDDSSDDTAAAAARAAAAVISSRGLPAGWTGKLWALQQGIAAAEASRPDYLLLSDADIVHAPDTLRRLIAHASNGRYVLTSLMAKLRCESLAERSHVPAFIYFFQMLFPFSWVSRRERATAAAAGGCMLVQAKALAGVGGIGSIRNALIDDCALAARLKTVGPIWLGLTERVRSIRPYDTLADVKQMIARSAYAQLRYSPLWLAGAAFGMALTFLAPPLLAITAGGLPRYLGLVAWLLMALSFVPTLRFYRLSPFWSIALPVIAALYLFYTFTSAYRHWLRRGGQWKGRVHVNAPSLQ
jgi:hopene-associated glycosyltransferase HpnB